MKERALAPVGVALLVIPVIAVSVASPCHPYASVLQRGLVLQACKTNWSYTKSPEGPEQQAPCAGLCAERTGRKESSLFCATHSPAVIFVESLAQCRRLTLAS